MQGTKSTALEEYTYSLDTPLLSPIGDIQRTLQVHPLEVAASALTHLWHHHHLANTPLIFLSPKYRLGHWEHFPSLLDRLVEKGQLPGQEQGQLLHWKILEPPPSAHGVASTPLCHPLLKADLMSEASSNDRHTVPDSPCGWNLYSFRSGWSALSVQFIDSSDGDLLTLVAVPPGHQDDWLSFLQKLEELQNDIVREEHRGRIECIGSHDHEREEMVIARTSFDDVILPEETLRQVAAQRCIFDETILARYASLRVPRLRKVLLIGQPGTGKTTLLKALGADHAHNGGLVFYVSASSVRPGGTTPWQHLAYALRAAATYGLPTMVLVEDFEMFLSNRDEMQRVLNTLDGVATPDNPAGTLLLATSNDPERIDPRIKDRPGRVDVMIEIGPVEHVELATRFLQRFLGPSYCQTEHAPLAPEFLKQPGSHIREVCLLGAIRALDRGSAEVSGEDLRFAHQTILNGRAAASDLSTCLPPPPRKRGSYFGKNR